MHVFFLFSFLVVFDCSVQLRDERGPATVGDEGGAEHRRGRSEIKDIMVKKVAIYFVRQLARFGMGDVKHDLTI